jgi:hypothetical protein
MKTPTATRRHTAPNGVRLLIESHPRELRSSSRIDSRITGHDFGTIYTTVFLDIPGDAHALTGSICLDYKDEDHWAERDLRAKLPALGARDSFDAIWSGILETRAELQDLDPANPGRRARNQAEIERAAQSIANKLLGA